MPTNPCRRTKILLASFAVIAALIINACDYSYFDEFPKFTASPEFVLPLLTGSLTIEDILPDQDLDNMEVDDDNFVTIVSRSYTSSQNADQIILLADQIMPFELPVNLSPHGKTVEKTDTIIKTVYNAGFDFGIGEELDSLRFSGGSLELLVSEPQMSDDGYEVYINATIPFALDINGNPLTIDFMLNEKTEISLDSYLFKFYSTENSINLFDIEYSIHITGKGDKNNYELLFDQKFVQLGFFGLYGDIISLNLEFPGDTLFIPLFEKWEEGMISFADPSMILKADNSFGFLTHVYFETLRAANNSSLVDLITYDPVSIYPWVIDNANYPGHSAVSYLNLNRETSNIDDFINLPPKEIIYFIEAALLSHQTTQGFITNDSKLDLDLEFRLPLHGSISNFVLKETFDVSPGDISDNIEKLELHMAVINSFPIDAGLQMKFLDQHDNILFTLFDDDENSTIISSAKVNEEGEVIEETSKESVISLTPEKIEKLNDSKQITVQIKLQTAEEGEIPIKIYTHQSIGIKMHLQGKFFVEI